MKAILKLVKPKICANIMNLIQSILVIKNEREAKAIQKLIDENGYADIYGYCANDYDMLTLVGNEWTLFRRKNKKLPSPHNGKVIFKFRCYKVEEYPYISDRYDELIGSCLSEKELLDYSTISFKDNVRVVKSIYAIHISDLEIFDEPKEINEFIPYYSCTSNHCPCGKPYCTLHKPLTKAPKDYCYIEVKE